LHFINIYYSIHAAGAASAAAALAASINVFC